MLLYALHYHVVATGLAEDECGKGEGRMEGYCGRPFVIPEGLPRARHPEDMALRVQARFVTDQMGSSELKVDLPGADKYLCSDAAYLLLFSAVPHFSFGQEIDERSRGFAFLSNFTRADVRDEHLTFPVLTNTNKDRIVPGMYHMKVVVRDLYPGLSDEESLIAATTQMLRVDDGYQRHKALVRSALSHSPLWREALDADIKVVLLSDNPLSDGIQSFRVSCDRLDGTVFLKLYRQPDRAFLGRIVSISRIMAARGLAPRVLASGDSWIISEWVPGFATAWRSTTLEEGKRIGRLLAQIHSVDTAWFDDTRAEIVRENPAWETGIPNGSTAWVHFAGMLPMKKLGISSWASAINEWGFDRSCHGGLFMRKLPPGIDVMSTSSVQVSSPSSSCAVSRDVSRVMQ